MKKLTQSKLKAFFRPGGSSRDPLPSALSSGGPSESAGEVNIEADLENILQEGGILEEYDMLQDETNTLEADMEQKRKWEQRALYKRSGGRRPNVKIGLESRGIAGGWNSNRLYSGMERRRQDWSAAEGVDICDLVQKLKAENATAAEVNRCLLEKMGGLHGGAAARCKRVRSLQAVWKKGATFWKERLKKVQVGKHSKNKKGGVLKRVCKASEAKGCRAGGAGRKDRFVCYKAV